MKTICCNDVETLKELFNSEANVLALGKGAYYKEVSNFISFFGMYFKDVIFTEENAIGIKTDSGVDYKGAFDNFYIVICASNKIKAKLSLLKNNISEDRLFFIDMKCKHDKCIDIYKKNIFQYMCKKHEYLITEIRKKNKIKIFFMVINKGIWKLDLLYQKMSNDEIFEPIICIVPNSKLTESEMWHDINEMICFFEKKDYRLQLPYDFVNKRWRSLDEFGVDVVFFTFPHNNTFDYYYEDACFKYLSCYAGYGVNVAALRSYLQFDQVFHNAQWINFANSLFVNEAYSKYSAAQGSNACYAGDVTCELLIYGNNEDKKQWKSNKKRIIYAPHHSIEEDLKYSYKLSTFLKLAIPIRNLAQKYKNETIWAFRPHPWLRIKLYNHPDWGVERTDEYYKFWEVSDFTQFENEDYIGLFRQSDLMIHDSASFLYEYLAVKKPVVYLMSELTLGSLNQLGREALNCCYTAGTIEEVEVYISELVNYNLDLKKEHDAFYDKEFESYHKEKPTDKIIHYIKNILR